MDFAQPNKPTLSLDNLGFVGYKDSTSDSTPDARVVFFIFGYAQNYRYK